MTPTTKSATCPATLTPDRPTNLDHQQTNRTDLEGVVLDGGELLAEVASAPLRLLLDLALLGLERLLVLLALLRQLRGLCGLGWVGEMRGWAYGGSKGEGYSHIHQYQHTHLAARQVPLHREDARVPAPELRVRHDGCGAA